jgi:RsiW-degrading membrane proteinase PrsW (M82 family)
MSHPSWELAISGAVPAMVAMWLVDRLDRKRPEPLRLRRLSAAFGMVTVLPAVILEQLIVGAFGDNVGPRLTYQGASFHAFFVAAGIEEACKISVLYWLVWWQPEFDERMDGIVYASRAGLGFALVENVMYLFGEHTLGGQIETWVMRAVLAVPGHAMWTGMAGAMAARRRFDRKGLGLVGGYLLAVAFHGAYDFTAFLQAPLQLEGYGYLARLAIPMLALLTVVAFLVLRGMAKSALRLDDLETARRST